MDTTKPTGEGEMGEKKLDTMLSPRQRRALEITADQPAASIRWHSLSDFALKVDPLTDQEFKAFTDGIEALRQGSLPRNPF